VMRGEETQLFGARQLFGERSDGWYLLPGTHSKWVQLRAGRVAWMRTYLSGELFGLLRERGTLSSVMRSGQLGDDLSVAEQAAFEQGVAAAAGAALGNALFAARARVVTGGLAPELGAAFVSGALLGAEWHDMARHLEPAQTVRLIGEARLCAHHARCAALLGFATEALDTPAVQTAAWMQLRKDGPR
jgi:2-dehydro-3-deoxygalactonokinase